MAAARPARPRWRSRSNPDGACARRIGETPRGLSVRRAIAITAAALFVAPASGWGATATPLTLLGSTAVSAGAAVERSCLARPLARGTRGADVRTLTTPASGWLDARLDGSAHGPDWDLAVFDATGRLVG